MSIRIYGKRQIQTLEGLNTRPTSSRVREAVFNIWFSRLPGARWLDLCAGSGAMGAEALARGVDAVVGIEQQGKACRVIEQNWKKVAQSSQSCQVIKGELPTSLKKLTGCFHLVYFDPPYASELYEPVLSQLGNSNLLANSAAIAAEHHKDNQLCDRYGELIQVKRKDYGQTSVSFFEFNS